MKFAGRAALAVLLLLGVYVLAAAVIGILGYLLYQAVSHGAGGFVVGKGFFLTLLVALALVRAFWAVRRVRGVEPQGLELSRDDHPQLWAEVEELAGAVGTRAPDAIRLVPQVNASVWEDSRFLGLVAGRRVMTLGAPLVMGLSRQQLRAVLAHELGHYSHRHTALSPVVYRGQVTLGHLVDRLGHDTLTGKLFAAYGRLYLRLTRSVTRRQEVEADDWSHRLAGRTAAAGAMRELPALDGIWTYFLEEQAFRVEGVRPDALFAGFGDLLASPQRQGEMEALRTDLPEEPQDPYDTHPSLRSRVEHFESLPDDGLAVDGAPALALLRDPDTTLRDLEAEMFAEAELEPRPWEWIAERAGIQRARSNAAMLVRATREPGFGAATLQDAVRALARGETSRLVQPFVVDDTPAEHVDAIARRLVEDTVSAALVEHCGARFTLDSDANEILVDTDGRPVDVPGLLDAAVDGGSADGLVSALQDEGVPSSYSVDPAALDAEAARDQEPVVHSVATCMHRRRLRTLVVAENALIVKRLGLREGIAAGLQGAGSGSARAIMLYVASIPLPRLLEDRRAETFSWERVTDASLSGRRLALTLDGKRRRLRVERDAVAGDLVGSLRQQLGDRLAVA